MLHVRIEDDRLYIGEHFALSFQRTLRLPDDGREYPLPPGLGRLPIMSVSDFARWVPREWKEHGGVFVPMYQREAMWLSFFGDGWHPNAVKIGIGGVNALSGMPWEEGLGRGERDYCVIPDQSWIDGINTGNGRLRQFVPMPLGTPYTVKGQVTGKEEFQGVRLKVYESKPGRFPNDPPPAPEMANYFMRQYSDVGEWAQRIHPDPYGIGTWDETNFGRIYIHIVNSEMYREITGMAPPASPVTPKEYTKFRLPWLDLYEEKRAHPESDGGRAEASD